MLEDRLGRPVRWEYDEQNRRGDHICYISDLAKLQSHFRRGGSREGSTTSSTRCSSSSCSAWPRCNCAHAAEDPPHFAGLRSPIPRLSRGWSPMSERSSPSAGTR